jgi:hypothetical protein
MWNNGNQKIVHHEDYNNVLRKFSGKTLNDIEARLTLAKFLKSNIGLTYRILTGGSGELLPFQELMLRGMFCADNSLFVFGRGCGKSHIISVFCLLYPIFYPNSKIVLISANFRASRRVLLESEKITKAAKATLFASCFENEMRRGNDIFSWKLNNGSEIHALPLSKGDGLRGQRSSCVIVDEGLLITKDIQESIIRPFLTARQNYQEEKEIRQAEDYLIKKSVITEKDRLSFPRNKYQVFSSASYQFEYLYEMFMAYKGEITKSTIPEENPPRFFIWRMGFEALPKESFLDTTQIHAAAANGGNNTDYFKKEYQAIFTDVGNGYFNVKKLLECTIRVGEEPTVQYKGVSDYQYLLTIDSAMSSSKDSDFFAMGVYLLVPQERKFIQVHSYAKNGGDLKHHYEYLTYLLTQFNIVFVAYDATGPEFLHGYNESTIAKQRNLKLGFLTADFEDENYPEQLAIAKKEHSLTGRNFAYGVKFNTITVRKMNEYLQGQIEARKVWFASRICANADAFERAIQYTLPFEFKDNFDKVYTINEFLEDQDDWIDETKKEVSLIEVTTSQLGALRYDLPQSLKHNRSVNKPRKDLYTCLLMATYASRFYFDLMYTEIKPAYNTFTPIIVR